MSDPGQPGLSLHAVPRACTATDRAAELSPEEGFILAHIDGVTPVGRLVELSSLPPESTLAVLTSLAAKNAIVILEPGTAARAGECDAEGPPPPEPAIDLVSLRQILRSTLPKGEALIPIIESIFVNLEQLSYYELLGIKGGEAPDVIRKAYLHRTKSFHPDRFYRKLDRQFRDRVQEVFKQLNKGYNVVSDPESRAEYDKTPGLEQTPGGPQAEAVEEVIEAGPRASRLRGVKGQSPWKQIRVSRHQPIEDKVRPAPRPVEAAKPVGPKLKLGLKDGKSSSPLMKKILAIKKEQEKQKNEEGGAATSEQAERLYKGAMTEMHRGNSNSARINLRLAIQYAPSNQKYKDALAELEHGEEKQKAEFEFRAGLDAHREGNLQGAARHYRAALQAGLENAKLFHKLAQLLMELENNNEKARVMVLKAIEMEPGVAEYHATLARAYKGLGQKAASIMQLEKAVKLDPGNKLLAKELKALKRG
jgi:curved DNA-binding protein CbpA